MILKDEFDALKLSLAKLNQMLILGSAVYMEIILAGENSEKILSHFSATKHRNNKNKILISNF